MKILILPDSFKNCLSSDEVAKALTVGILRVFPDAEIAAYPVADGGEGTVDAFISATGGETCSCMAHDALGRPINAFYGVLPGDVAVVESAAASGFQHLLAQERNPLIASSYGTGEIIAEVLKHGYRDIILGLGGSVTNDGGVGMAKALGFQFLNANDEEIGEGGGSLHDLNRIDASAVLPALREASFRVACDVKNPLTGPTGASVVYGPQKGATPEMVKMLDANLTQMAKVIKKDLNIEVSQYAGAGAAGGLGAGTLAFLQADLISGFDIVAEVLQLQKKIADADIIITAEGKIDAQTLNGKGPYAVAQLAKAEGKKVIAFAGQLGEEHQLLYQHGFNAIFPIAECPMSLVESIKQAPFLLANASERVFRMFL